MKRVKEMPIAYLVPMPRESFSRAVRLGLGETSIGRDLTNDIRLAHGSVSRVHARITWEDGRYVIHDLDSRNGVFVNKRPIQKAALSSGDVIHLGNRRFVFKTEAVPTGEAEEQPSPLPDTLPFSDEEMHPDELVTKEAEEAAQTFLRVPQPSSDGQEAPALMAHGRLSLLYRLSEQVRSSGAVDDILNLGLASIFEALPSAERAVALLGEDGGGGRLEVRGIKYKDRAHEEGEKTPISRTVLKKVVSERVAVVSRNLLDDSRFQDSTSIRLHNLKSIICVPLIIGGKALGAVHIDTSDFLNPFTPGDMEFAAAVANEMALSIENDRLQQNVIRNERMAAIGMTVTNIAHNIKNMLHLNVNAIELMDQHLDAVDDEKIHTRWFLLKKGMERMNRLASDMLEFARFEPTGLALVDVNAVLEENRDFLEKTLFQKGIKLEWSLAPELPARFMNEEQLQRALLNLVVNAEDALKDVEGGRIRISTALDSRNRVLVRVTDNGCGVPEEDLRKIFHLFYTTKGTDGSGLGLPMVQKFVESAGGKVAVQSAAGKGASFTMIFPPTEKAAFRPGVLSSGNGV